MNPAPPVRSVALGSGPRPSIIAHRGGNSEKATLDAISDGADLVEVDLWTYRRRLEARHARRIPPTRVLFERWYLSWSARLHYSLPDLLAVAGDRVGVLLDFKNRHMAGELVAAALETVSHVNVRVCASSQFWPILRLVHAKSPSMEMYYSIDVQPQLDLFLSVVQRDERPTGVSCNHRRLTPDLVRRFHDLGLAIIAWTVNDPDRAAELAEWGVDAITTDRVSLIRERVHSR